MKYDKSTKKRISKTNGRRQTSITSQIRKISQAYQVIVLPTKSSHLLIFPASTKCAKGIGTPLRLPWINRRAAPTVHVPTPRGARTAAGAAAAAWRHSRSLRPLSVGTVGAVSTGNAGHEDHWKRRHARYLMDQEASIYHAF